MFRLICCLLMLCMVSSAWADDELVQGFAAPNPEFSPVPIWWWSGDPVEREQIHVQLEKMSAGGIHNAIILNLAPSGPLYGSAADEPPLLTDAWWDLFGYAIQEAKRAGVRLWFYDQLGFSGAGLQARVVRDHPEFRGVRLERLVADVDDPKEVELRTPPSGTPLAAFIAHRVDTPGNPDIPKWIWDGQSSEKATKRYFRRIFELATTPVKAHVILTVEDGYELYVNGAKIGQQSVAGVEGRRKAERYDIASNLREGKNVIAIAGENQGDDAGLVLEAAIGEGDTLKRIYSDNSFRVSSEAPDGWLQPDFDDAQWPFAKAIGPLGCGPWGSVRGFTAMAAASFGAPIRAVRDITKEIADGVLKTRVDAAKMRVMLFYTVPGGFDYQNPEACKALLDLFHGELARRFPDELGKSIAGSFEDEFPALPHYSTRMPDQFYARCSYNLLAKLPALYDDVTDRFGDSEGPSMAQIRANANKVAATLCEDAFFIPLEQWHKKYGLLCGYDQCVRTADPQRAEAFYIDYFRTMRHYSAPGNDMDGDIKPHQSISDLYGSPRVWIEAFHSSGWGQTLEEIGTLLHPWIANGATLFDPHAIYYSIHGSYWEWAPPDTGWRQPYFRHYDELANYSARLCNLLSKGSHVVQVGVLHPSATVSAYTGFGEADPAAESAGDTYWAVQDALRNARLDYIIVDEDSLQRARINNGALAMGSVELKSLILPAARVLEGRSIEKLAHYVEGGGTVVFVGAAPSIPADRYMKEQDAKLMFKLIASKARHIQEAEGTVEALGDTVPRSVAEKDIVLQRHIGDRDFYFALSDDGTLARGKARFEINQRKLYETDAAQGGRMSLTVQRDGVPEVWNALTGQVTPLLNFRRQVNDAAQTRLDIDLAATPAPLVAMKAAAPEDPRAVESDLEIVSLKRDGKTIEARGLPRIDATQPPPAEHALRVEYADAAFDAKKPAAAIKTIPIEGPLACNVEPTCENSDGSFAWPPYKGYLPVETRAFRFHAEQAGDDAAALAKPDLDDSGWTPVLASFGPRALGAGPIDMPADTPFDTMAPPPVEDAAMHPAVYSLKLGIDEDPVFSSALGGKGRIPEEFIDLGEGAPGKVYVVRATITLPPNTAGAENGLPALLRVGANGPKRAILNGAEVAFAGPTEEHTVRAETRLQPGPNRLELLVAAKSDARLRIFYQFLPVGGAAPDAEWIWAAQPSPNERSRFSKTIDINGSIKSAAMVVALGDMHQIRINDTLVADQGNFDAYFMSRSERYDIAKFLKPGVNTIAIEAEDTGKPTGLLLDGLVTLEDGAEIPFVSDASFESTPAGVENAQSAPARVLNGPARGYMGDPALLRLRPRPHPLPYGGWLVDQPAPPAPFDKLSYAATENAPAPGWFRFLLPPGATTMRFHSPGAAKLYVNGAETPLTNDSGAYAASLPDVDAPRRVAALRIESIAGFEQGAAIAEPITYEMGPGRIPFGSWNELGLPHYAGGLVYSAEVTVPEKPDGKIVLDLGRVRGCVDVSVNGVACGVRIWHPYRFDITEAVKPGANTVAIRVFNTLGPHFAQGHPSRHVFDGQIQSGLFGPVKVHLLPAVDFKITNK
jgi:hypothetical protein